MRVMLLALGVAAALAIGGCGSSSSPEGSRTTKIAVDPAEWEVISAPNPHTIVVSVSMGECVADPGAPHRAKIVRTRVKEGPNESHVTVYVPHIQTGDKFCADILTGDSQRIHLAHPLGGQVLYDDAVSPAAIRWPKRLAVPVHY